jgi:hypothetical protein
MPRNFQNWAQFPRVEGEFSTPPRYPRLSQYRGAGRGAGGADLAPAKSEAEPFSAHERHI